jgi:hypothetical protein
MTGPDEASATEFIPSYEIHRFAFDASSER